MKGYERVIIFASNQSGQSLTFSYLKGLITLMEYRNTGLTLMHAVVKFENFNSLDLIANFYYFLSMLGFIDEKVLERVKQWQIKASQENNSFNRFISLWIAYNMIYGIYSKKEYPLESFDKNNDGEKAVRIKNLLINSEPLKQYLIQNTSELADSLAPFREEYWKKDQISLIKHLHNASRKRSYEHLIDTILKILYKIRCNLFHGEKEFLNGSQNELLRICSNILEEILNASIIEFTEYSLTP